MYTRNWESLQKPQRVEVLQSSQDYGRFVVEPLEKGFGITIGHALRRVLLSSMQGCAVVAVKIEGVSHEFESISGVREDVVQLVLNLKGLQLKQLNEGVHEMELVGAGPTELKALDIVTGGKVEVMNPSHIIAHLDEGAEIQMRIFAVLNKGYVPAEENKYEELPSDVIFLDSVHTPIKRINYEVENARVAQRTDYDRLIFEIWTNGAIAPADALGYASKILKEHMNMFINFDEVEADTPAPVPVVKSPEKDSHFHLSISELELSVRSINCLQNANIQTIGELVQRTEQDMLRTKNFGRKSLNEIKSILETLGLHLGMRAEEVESNLPH